MKPYYSCAYGELYKGDCLEVIPLLGQKVDLVLTDPPFLHVKGGMKSKRFNVGSWKEDSFLNTNMTDFGEHDIQDFLNCVITSCKKTNMYVFCSKLQLPFYFRFITENKLKFDLLVWDKTNRLTVKNTRFFSSNIDYIIKIYEGGVSLRKVRASDSIAADSSYYSKIQSFKQPKGEHQTPKPVELLTRFLMLSSDAKDLVLDPFAGSSSTAIACINTNRKFIMIEKEEKYCEISAKRIEEHINSIWSDL